MGILNAQLISSIETEQLGPLQTQCFPTFVMFQHYGSL